MIVSPAPRLGPSAGVTKSCTLYVGKIAATVDNSVIKALLDACGTVKSWKRVEDTETGKPKPFGFCEYEDAEGVLMAMSNLNELALDGQGAAAQAQQQHTELHRGLQGQAGCQAGRGSR